MKEWTIFSLGWKTVEQQHKLEAMTKLKATPHKTQLQSVVIKGSALKGVLRRSIVKFGNVTVTANRPTETAAVEARLASVLAAESLRNVFAKRGVVLRAKGGVPQYWASDDEPDVYVRRLDGKTELGRLVDGIFQVLG